MGYPPVLKVATRKLNENVVISSAPFSVRSFFQLGARMACINCDGNIVIWSPLPWGDHVLEALQMLTGKTSSEPSDFNVSHIVVSNIQHDVGVRSVQPHFPKAHIVGSYRLNNDRLDYKVDRELGNRPITMLEIARANGKDDNSCSDLQFVYLSKHANRELLVFDKRHRTLFESDVLVASGDRGPDSCLEQYSEATGFEKGHNPHTGLAALGNLLYPLGWVSQWILKRLCGLKFAEGVEGCKAVYGLGIETIVPSHGNVIEGGAGEVLKREWNL